MSDLTTKRGMARRRTLSAVLVALFLSLSPAAGSAQFLGQSPKNVIRNMSDIKLPVGSRVGIVVFEDLGCPACAKAHPIERDVAKKTNAALLRYDFPIPSHIWTFEGAVCARYIQNKISPQLADQFRSDVFASQRMITSKEDIDQFTSRWLKSHGQKMPFVLDPDGSLAKAVKADYDLGNRINLQYTPTVVVITKDRYQVVCGVGPANGPDDPNQILPVVEAALQETAHAGSAATHRTQVKKQ